MQRKFTKKISGFSKLSYYQRMSKLNLESLDLRRLRNDLIHLYKDVFGLSHSYVANTFKIKGDQRVRGHKYKLLMPHCTNTRTYNAYPARAITVWNTLPVSVNFSSLRAFRNSLPKQWLLVHCKVYFQ